MALALIACASGTLVTPDGRQPIRTALLASDGESGTLLLSNGDLGCDLPPADDVLASADALFAACREGARHVVVRLDGPDGAQTSPQADYIEVLEAAVRSEDGLVRELEVSARAVHSTVDVRLDWSDPSTGRVQLLELDVSARFSAGRCAPDSDLFTAIDALGALSCP